MQFHKWPKIRRFSDVVRYVTARRSSIAEGPRPPAAIPYVGTVKIHGTNAGVCVNGDDVRPQSRSRFITPESDNLGFAAWCAGDDVREAMVQLAVAARVVACVSGVGSDEAPVTLYGEWCGPGIQKGVAVSSLPQRHFVLFGARLSDGTIVDPPKPDAPIERLGIFRVDRGLSVHVPVDFDDPGALSRAADSIERHTLDVEERCPYAARFGVEGIGEGLVWVPEDLALRQDTDLWFKSKGDKHQKAMKKRTPMAPMLPEQFASIQAFVDANVDEARLQRAVDGLREDGHPIAIESTGHFLKWVGGDVKDECGAELDASGLEWKQVARHVNSRAAAWFRQQVA